MAAADHNSSRRALLGAAVALPLVGVPGHCERSEAIQTPAPAGLPRRSAPRNDGGWARALAAFERAEAGLRAFERRMAGAPWEVQDAVEQGMDACLDAFLPALRRLLRTPAPDVEALPTKFAPIAGHQAGEPRRRGVPGRIPAGHAAAGAGLER